MTFSKFDLKFLKSVGIRADDISLDTDSHDPTLEFLKANGLPLTRENYLYVAYLGNPPKELDAESEANLPDGLGQ
jgi:hypothetical protein